MSAIPPCFCTMLQYINLIRLHISIFSSHRWILNSVHLSPRTSGTSRRFWSASKWKRWSTSVFLSVGTTTRRRYPKVTLIIIIIHFIYIAHFKNNVISRCFTLHTVPLCHAGIFHLQSIKVCLFPRWQLIPVKEGNLSSVLYPSSGLSIPPPRIYSYLVRRTIGQLVNINLLSCECQT